MSLRERRDRKVHALYVMYFAALTGAAFFLFRMTPLNTRAGFNIPRGVRNPSVVWQPPALLAVLQRGYTRQDRITK